MAYDKLCALSSCLLSITYRKKLVFTMTKANIPFFSSSFAFLDAFTLMMGEKFTKKPPDFAVGSFGDSHPNRTTDWVKVKVF